MNTAIKWIGSASGAIALLFATATAASYALETEAEAPRMTADNVLWVGAPTNEAEVVDSPAEVPEPVETVTAATTAEPNPEVAPTPSFNPNEPFVIKRILPISGPIKYGEWHWDDEDVPAGPLVMTVDLDARVISVFRNGYEIGAAAVLLGTQDHPTPLGAFPILQKKRHNISSIYGAPMPYTMRLTWDGISIHGSPVENGYASHGCIGTPDGFAAKLFAIVKKGDIAIITRGKMTGIGNSLVEG